MANKAGILGDLIEAGFRILESACGPCIGMGFAPNSEGVSLRTFNRNFKGRSGTADANVYLVSPETAAASAITGVFTDATTLQYEDPAYSTGVRLSLLNGGDKRLSLAQVQDFATNSGMLIPPLAEKDAAQVEILRGPNIKPCPPCREAADTLSFPVLLKAGDNVSTDDIMPAGTKVLPFRSNVPEISKFTYERIDADFYKRAEETGFGGCFVVGAENFGQGSSREHAALGPMYLGVRAVIVKSFARIHKANLINYNIIPITFANPADYDRIQLGDTLTLSNINKSLENGTPFEITVKGKNGEIKMEGVNDLAKRSRDILLAGGLAAYTRKGGN
jgi:aconitate hydratase